MPSNSTFTYNLSQPLLKSMVEASSAEKRPQASGHNCTRPLTPKRIRIPFFPKKLPENIGHFTVYLPHPSMSSLHFFLRVSLMRSDGHTNSRKALSQPLHTASAVSSFEQEALLSTEVMDNLPLSRSWPMAKAQSFFFFLIFIQ